MDPQHFLEFFESSSKGWEARKQKRGEPYRLGNLPEAHPDKIHLVGGVSLSVAKMNIIDNNGFGLKWIFVDMCREGEYQNRDTRYIQARAGVKVIIIAGGAKENDAARIKGFALRCVYFSEENECCQSFIQECFGRTGASGRPQIFLGLNPKPLRY